MTYAEHALARREHEYRLKVARQNAAYAARRKHRGARERISIQSRLDKMSNLLKPPNPSPSNMA
jgi:hypothetical protein